MAEVILQGDIFNKLGCMDPLATNYDPTATNPCSDCCTYGSNIIGCTDPLAVNYDKNATTSCNDCCVYKTAPIVEGFIRSPDSVIVGTLGGGVVVNECVGPFTVNTNDIVEGVTSAACCSTNYIGPVPVGYTYSWVQGDTKGGVCKIIKTCPTNLTCVNCINFDWWNDTYIANHNGQSFSVTSPLLWQQIVDLITNSGKTISVNTLNGEPITQECCKGVFQNGICFCEQAVAETYEPRCIKNLTDFLNLISTTAGYNFFITNFSTIGPSLGLTATQINFIKLYINSAADSNGNGIQDLTEARLILSNALNVTGGFHVNFGTVTNTPILMTKGVCDQYGGFWDSTGTVSTGGSTGTGLDNGGLGTGTIGTQVGPVRPTPTGTIDLGGQQVGTTLLRTVGTVETVTPNPTPNPTTNGNCMCKPVVDQCEIDLSQVQVVNSFDFFNNPIQVVNLTQGNTPLNEACCNRLINDNPNLNWVWQAPYCLASPKEDCLPAVFELNNNKPMQVPACENDLELSMWLYFGKPNDPCQPIPDPPDNDVIVIEGEFCDITLTPNTNAVQPSVNLGNIEIGTNLARAIGNQNLLKEVGNTEPVVVISPTGTCCYNTANPILARVSTTEPFLNQFLTQVKTFNSATDYFNRWVQIKATLPTSGLTLNFGLNLEIYQGLNCCCDYDFFIDDIQVNCLGQVPELIYNNIQCPGFNLTKVIDNKKSWVYNPGIPTVGITEYDNIERIDGSFGLLNGEGTINRTFAPSLDADIPWRYTDYWQQSSVYEKHSKLVLNTKELWLTFDMCADCPISGTTLACPSGYTLSASTNICYQNVVCTSYYLNNVDPTDCVVNYTDCFGSGSSIVVSALTSTTICATSVLPSLCIGLLVSATTVCSAFTLTTTATTVPTVTYLSLYDLENYKKQFQSFWIPFMEQFIPATTIWVAGERWCNEVCTIIDPCDYDFELVDSEVSYEQVPPGFFPSGLTVSFTTPILSAETSNVVSLGSPTAVVPVSSPTLTPVVDLGETTLTPIIKTVEEASIDLSTYRNKFTSQKTERLIV